MPDPYRLLRTHDAPDWQAAAIDRDAYTSSERLAGELAQVFGRTWLIAGRLDQVRTPGDYFTVEIGGESILVVHAGETGLHAFHNVCRHRGRELVEAGSCGQARSFRCPYHSWTYGLDGRLRSVTDAEAFPTLAVDTLHLVPVRVEAWNELVFITLDPAGEPLAAYLGELTDALAGAFAPAVLVTARRYEFEANWKTALEAFIETNHIASLHPQVAKTLDFRNTAVAHFRRHSLTVVPATKAQGWSERRTGDWRAWIDDAALLELHYTIFPNSSVHVFLWGLTFLFRCLPHRSDPERMTMDVWAWKRLAPGETPPAPLSMPDAMLGVLQQDYANIPAVQRGVRSRAFAGPQLGVLESRIGHLHAVLAGYLNSSRA